MSASTMEEDEEIMGTCAHIRNCEKVLRILENAQLTFSRETMAFGQEEILVIGHLCGPYKRRPSSAKVDVI